MPVSEEMETGKTVPFAQAVPISHSSTRRETYNRRNRYTLTEAEPDAITQSSICQRHSRLDRFTIAALFALI